VSADPAGRNRPSKPQRKPFRGSAARKSLVLSERDAQPRPRSWRPRICQPGAPWPCPPASRWTVFGRVGVGYGRVLLMPCSARKDACYRSWPMAAPACQQAMAAGIKPISGLAGLCPESTHRASIEVARCLQTPTCLAPGGARADCWSVTCSMAGPSRHLKFSGAGAMLRPANPCLLVVKSGIDCWPC